MLNSADENTTMTSYDASQYFPRQGPRPQNIFIDVGINLKNRDNHQDAPAHAKTIVKAVVQNAARAALLQTDDASLRGPPFHHHKRGSRVKMTMDRCYGIPVPSEPSVRDMGMGDPEKKSFAPPRTGFFAGSSFVSASAFSSSYSATSLASLASAFAADFFATGFLATGFLAAGFLTADFLAADFLAASAVFLARISAT